MDKIFLLSLVEQIRETVGEAPFECCGVYDNQLIKLDNLAEDTENEFVIDYDGEPALIWHTHWRMDQPGRLEGTDIENSRLTKVPYLLYHTLFDEWDYYEPNNPYPLVFPNGSKELSDYEKLPFQWNRFDCYALVRLYYYHYLDTQLPDFARSHFDPESMGKQITENLELAGFSVIDEYEPLMTNDLVAIGLADNYPHHLAVCIDVEKELFLHVVGDKYVSQIFKWNRYYEERTILRLRYRDFGDI